MMSRPTSPATPVTLTTRIAAVALAVAAAGTMSACGGGDKPPAPATQTGPADPHATYERLVAEIYGTPAQRDAVQEVAYLRGEIATAACFSKTGVAYPIAAYTPLPDPGDAGSPDTLAGFAPVRHDFGVASGIIRFAAIGAPVTPGLAAATTPAARAAFQKALDSCQTAGADDAADDAPAARQNLAGKLIAALTAVQNEAAPKLATTYPVCMKAAGVVTTDMAAAIQQVRGKFPQIDFDKPTDATKAPGWSAAEAFEAKVAAADAGCRMSSLPTVMAAAGPALTAFAAANKPALDSVAATWTKAETDVQTLRAQAKPAA
jgi:hypothetical protein